jgi:hypothetical protein
MIAGMAVAGSQQMATSDANVRMARARHLATFVVGAFGLAVQLWIAATHDLTYDGVVFSTHVRLWNVLSFFTIWSNILVTVVAYLLTRAPRRTGGMFQMFRLASLVGRSPAIRVPTRATEMGVSGVGLPALSGREDPGAGREFWWHVDDLFVIGK